MAYEFAKKEKIRKLPKSWTEESKMAGINWYYGFIKRHPRIVLRTPRRISIQRVKCFNKEAVDGFYSQLGSLYNEHHYPRGRIWNMDETDVERLISADNRLKTKLRSNITIESENKYLYIHSNMSDLVKWNPTKAAKMLKRNNVGNVAQLQQMKQPNDS